MATAKKFSTVINGVMVADLFSTIDAIKTTPAIAKFNFRIRNQWEGGSHNRSTVDNFYGAAQQLSHPKPFVLHADEPAVLLGQDTAANPVEYLLHALASCLTTSMVYHAAARGIQIQEVESSFEGDIDLHGFLDLDPGVRKGYQGIRVNFKVKADVPDRELEDIVKLGSEHSPVFDSLTNGVPVSITAERM
ncbi:MAG TPA: OsmC family protein [Terriglobales bacterium]|nr:OsmC family protein [Terriglobales bacterium]